MSPTHELGHLAEGQDRMTLLQHLVDQMSFDERCAVSAMISERNDPLAILPVELIIEILSHLPIFEAWRLQLVGRKWRSLFSSEAILRAALARWETHSDSDSARSPSQTANESIRTKARHMQALRLGAPFSRMHFRCDILPTDTGPGQSIILKGSRLAYICGERDDSVVVRQLTTGQCTRLRGDARESIYSMALGSDMVAFVTHCGRIYAQDLSDPKHPLRSARLPSASVQAMHVNKFTVGMVLQGKRSIALFDVKRGSLRSFNVNLDPQPAVTPTDHAMRRHTEVSLLVDCDGGIVDIFRDGGSNPLREWSHARYSMTGQQITTSSLQSPPRQEPPPASWKIVGPFQAHSFMPRPSGYQGLFNNGSVLFWPGHHSHDVDAHSRDGRPWRKCFDLRKAQLRKQYVLGMSEADKNDYDTSTGVQAWKDISLQTRGLVGDEVGNEEGRFGALVTRTITDDIPRFRSQITIPADPPHDLDNEQECSADERQWEVAGLNDSFLVLMQCQYYRYTQPGFNAYYDVCVYSFEENLTGTAGFESTEIWGREDGRLGTVKSSDPKGHAEPYPKRREEDGN